MSIFNSVPIRKPKKNAFDLSFENRLTADFGQLIPVLCEPVLPGDIFRIKTESLVKLDALLAPVMSRIDVYLHYFFVPNRLIFNDWENFITGGVNGTLTPQLPTANMNTLKLYIGSGSNGVGDLCDYLGIPQLPPTVNSNTVINVLRFNAYQKIYDDWYRDELLDTSDFFVMSGGLQSYSSYSKIFTLRTRAWSKDYFTSARTNTQLGNPVSLPLSGTLPVTGQPSFVQTDGGTPASGPVSILPNGYLMDSSSPAESLKITNGLTAALTNAGITVNDLRRSIRLQEWQEKNMLGGNRYIENIFAHFGVRSSDGRLQRSMFLGGTKNPVLISDVDQTSATASGQTALATRAGKGTSAGASQYIKFKSEEHGYLMCILSILPKAGYHQGINRDMLKLNRFDFAWPEFANIGEQEIDPRELYFNGAESTSPTAWGYQSRYSEYKFRHNEIHGLFRTSLNYWHNSRIFSSLPGLNSNFVHMNDTTGATGQNRIFAVTSNSGHFYVQLYHDFKAIRPLPKYGIPSI